MTIPAHAPRLKATANHRRMVERKSIGFMALLLPCKPQHDPFDQTARVSGAAKVSPAPFADLSTDILAFPPRFLGSEISRRSDRSTEPVVSLLITRVLFSGAGCEARNPVAEHKKAWERLFVRRIAIGTTFRCAPGRGSGCPISRSRRCPPIRYFSRFFMRMFMSLPWLTSITRVGMISGCLRR
jgi:hypothetical protein